jgi:hypothetical protein
LMSIKYQPNPFGCLDIGIIDAEILRTYPYGVARARLIKTLLQNGGVGTVVALGLLRCDNTGFSGCFHRNDSACINMSNHNAT